MAHQPNVWTGEARRLLYRRLVTLFGPLRNWRKSHSPGGTLDEDFVNFCEAYALAVGAKSGAAVKHQIRFAMPQSKSGSAWGRQSQTAILNKAAALEAGFIEDSHLPDLLAVGRETTQRRRQAT